MRPGSPSGCRTPQVSADAGTVNVKTEVVNQSAVTRPCTLRTDVLDPAGKLVASVSSTLTIPPGQTVTFDQTSVSIAHPLLWSPQQPHLYSIRTTVLDDGRPKSGGPALADVDIQGVVSTP